MARSRLIGLALPLVLASALPAQDGSKELEQAIADIDRLRGEGKLAEARARLASTVSLAKKGVGPALMQRLVLAQDALIVTAAAAYGRGEECGFIPEAERKQGGGTPRDVALVMFAELVARLDKLEDPAARTAYLKDPAFAPLRERPIFRCVFASSWRRPHREVWPGVQVVTGDHAFDALFDLTAYTALARPGEPQGPAQEWLAAAKQAKLPPGEAWASYWRRALLSPQDQGALPVASKLLGQPEVVAAMREQLRARAGPSPWGFDALCLLNLAIAAGDHTEALALLGRLERQGGFLYDQALDKAILLLQRLEPKDEARAALLAQLNAHALGLPPPAPAPQDEHGPLRDGLAELERLRAAGEVKKLRPVYEANKKRSRGKKLPPDLMNDVFAADLSALSAAAQVYARGEDAGWYTAEELATRKLAGKPWPEAAYALLFPVLIKLGGGPDPAAEYRHRLVSDPRLRALMETPLMRTASWSWGRPPAEVWPELKLVTGDPKFDALFAAVAPLSPRPGALIAPVHEYVKGSGGTSVAEVWLFRWRCALLAPAGEGGWPTRISLLRDPAAVGEALRALETKSGAEPSGFEALVRVNLHIALGQDDRARALVARLEREGGFLYDLAVTKGLLMVQNVSGPSTKTPLGDELSARACGLAPSR